MSQGAIISFRNDRLGARLISLVNALRVGRKFDLPVQVNWITTTGVGSEFNDPTSLFSREFVEAHFIDKADWRARRARCVRMEQFRSNPSQMVSHVRAGRDVLSGMAFGILTFDGEDHAAVARECGQVFRSLPMAPQLAPLVETIRRELETAVAYHIRRGDLVNDIRASNRSWPHKFVPDAYYRAHMEDVLKGGRRVILFSDSAACLESYAEAFPQLTTFEQIVPVEGLSRGAQDFLELFAMSCCQTIIAPESSAFSTTASELGGAAKIDVKQDLTQTRRAEIGDALLRTVEEDPSRLGEVGEFAQVIPHIAEHLTSAGRWSDCAEMYEKVTLTDRVPASFLYPQALDRFLEAGRVDLALRLGKMLPECPVYHDRDRVRCGLPLAAAAAASDDLDLAYETLRNVMAYQHSAGNLRKLLVYLASVGALPSDKFFPVSVEAMCFDRRKFGAAAFSGAEAVIAAKLVENAPNGLRGYLEPVSLDWSQWFLNGPNLKSVIEGNRGADFKARLMAAADAPQVHPEVSSLAGLIDVIDGGTDLARIERARHEDPANPLLWQRYAQALYLMRDTTGAAEAAREVVKRDTSPAYAGFAARILMRVPDARDEAGALIEHAISAGWNFAPFYAIQSDIAQAQKKKDAAYQSAMAAAALMPTTSNRYEVARKAMAVGDKQKATAIMQELRALQKLPRSAYGLLISALKDVSKEQAALEVLAEAQILFADKPDFLSQLEQV